MLDVYSGGHLVVRCRVEYHDVYACVCVNLNVFRARSHDDARSRDERVRDTGTSKKWSTLSIALKEM